MLPADEHASVPPDRIIAMLSSTRFSIDSYSNFADIYPSQAYVKPEGGGAMLVNVDQQTSARAGLARLRSSFSVAVLGISGRRFAPLARLRWRILAVDRLSGLSVNWRFALGRESSVSHVPACCGPTVPAFARCLLRS
ncbi:MAG: hypothetical protein AAGA68_23985 [Pseudomonadota bacterium]